MRVIYGAWSSMVFCSPGLLSKLFGEGRGSFIRLEPVVWELHFFVVWGVLGFFFNPCKC